MEPLESPYVELRTADVPIGWSNHPDLLHVNTYFAHHRVNETLHPSLYFSRPRPILTDTQSIYIFEEKGRGYFVWNDISGFVAEIKENSWEDIIGKMRDGGLFSMTLSPLRTVNGPSGEPTSNIPYLPNPDFVDRPRLTENLQIPPQRSVLLYGSGGSGKSELAINYANRVRSYSPETWIFWVCATTTQKFNEDLAAIADVLPNGPCTYQILIRMDFVLNWLCTQEGGRWLMVVDDVSSVELDFLSSIDTLWHSSGRGSFIFTSRGNLKNSAKPYFTRSTSRLEVPILRDSEALQLLQKKLKQPPNEDCRNLMTVITWTPLEVELAAASLNQSLISMSEFIAGMKSDEVNPLARAFTILFNSLNSSDKKSLYFISSFRPPEVPSLWLESFLKWSNDLRELDEPKDSLLSLTKLSLLAKGSGTNVFKMQAGVQSLIAGLLLITDGQNQFLENIKSFVDSRKFIPHYRFWDLRSASEKMISSQGKFSSFHVLGKDTVRQKRKHSEMSG